MLKYIKWITKALIAGIAAYLVLGTLSLLYYNISTFPTLPFYAQAYEGFGYSTLYKDGRMSHLDLPNNNEYSVVIMGSSHVDAIQVPQTKTVSYLLNEKLDGLGVYTKSGNAYYLLSQARDFSNILETKKPKYAIMETGTIDFNSESIQQYLTEEIPKSVTANDTSIINRINRNKIIRNIKRLPYIRLLTVQRGNLVAKNTNVVTAVADSTSATQEELNALLNKIKLMASDNKAKLIIYYHPRLRVDENGTVTSITDSENLKKFSYACANSGVVFVDMTDIFMNAYNTSYIFPHGFSNTAISSGHMNIHGHSMVAEELARIIIEMEE